MLKLVFIFSMCILTSVVSGQTPSQNFSDIAGVYVTSSGYTGYSVTLNSDGTYEKYYFSDCCEIYPRVKGSFTILNDIVRFVETPDEKKEKVYGDFEMNMVRWGERLYLVAEKDIPKFVATVNFEIEPRPRVIYRNSLSQGICLRKKDESKKVEGLPSSSANFNELVAAPRIELTIATVGLREKKKLVTANREKLDGIKVGMGFVLKGKKANANTVLWVVSVDEKLITLENASLSYVHDYKVGDVLVNKQSQIL